MNILYILAVRTVKRNRRGLNEIGFAVLEIPVSVVPYVVRQFSPRMGTIERRVLNRRKPVDLVSGVAVLHFRGIQTPVFFGRSLHLFAMRWIEFHYL